ncbi:IS4 family transposase [Salinibacter ruber]|uniref:IS4 family transposase n=1 Tax=Salinibacter ruber TaxID=146919 RepID=UPI002074314F
MARLIRALPIQTTTNLAQLAQVMKPQVETDSTYRRLQRFFTGFTFGYEALGQFLLELVPTDPPYVVAIDRTEWHFGQTAVNVLMIGVAYEGIAFPVTSATLGHGGGSGADEHTEVLEQFLRVVRPDQIRALVADREFTGSDFLEVLKERKVPFVIRLKVGRPVGPASGNWSLPARMFARTCGVQQSSLLGGRQVVGGAESIGVRIGLKRLEDGSFLILASRGVDPDSMFELYRQRWDIETLFAALKSRGFDLEATHLTEPDRIRKLLGVLALTYSWTRIIGLDRKRREGPPRECANGYPEKSLFRYGLDQLRELLVNWYRMQEELNRCIQVLTAPRLFLSCS